MRKVLEAEVCDMCGIEALYVGLFDQFGCCSNCCHIGLQLNDEDLAYFSPAQWEALVKDAKNPLFGGIA